MKNTPIKKDWFLMGFITGALSSIAKTATNFALNKARVPTVYYGFVASSTVLGKKAKVSSTRMPKRLDERILGHITDALFGGLFGSAVSYVITKSPPGNEVYKGMIGGIAIWATTFTSGKLLNLAALKDANAKQMGTVLTVSVLYGALQGWVLGKYGAKMTSQSHPILTKEVTDRQFDQERMDLHNPRQSESMSDRTPQAP